jgi:hypothetical protein
MVGTYATNWCLLKVEGIGNDPTANSADTGKGGLVWIKGRDIAAHSLLFDTERGVGNFIMSSLTNAEASSTAGTRLTAFNSNGFSLGTDPGSAINNSSYDYVSWTFRKQPGFFDIVTYTGGGQANWDEIEISHNLDSVPGAIFIKRTDSSDDWWCAVRKSSTQYAISTNGASSPFGLNTTNTSGAGGISSCATSTTFKPGFIAQTADALVNNATYVVYLFAHDDQRFGTDSDESIIKCGSYTGNGTSDNSIDIGFEPQWLLVKNVSLARDWVLSVQILQRQKAIGQ